MAGIFNKKNDNGRQTTYATKADVILQRQAEIVGKLDMLLAGQKPAPDNSVADKVNEKLAQELSYLSKQNSAIFEKVLAENAQLRREINFVSAQCENVFVKLSGMISSLEEKISESASDYDKVAEAAQEHTEAAAADAEPAFDDEVAPAAVTEEAEGDEQLTISSNGYIDYDELADRLAGKLEEKGLLSGLDYDGLAKKVADSMPPQEVISPDYIASKVAEQIVIPQVVVGENGEAKPIEVHATAEVDYDEIANRVAEKLAPAASSEEVVEAAAEQTAEQTENTDSDALADEIARKVSALSPNDFDIIVDDEGCRSLAEAVVENLDYDRIIEKLAAKGVAGEVAVTDAAAEETEPAGADEIAQLVSEKLAANGINEEAIADKTAAALSNCMPEVDGDEIADKVAAAVLASIPATEIDYDAIINGVAEKLGGKAETVETSSEEVVPAADTDETADDYDIVIDEEGLKKITESISWKVTASTNAMLEGMDDKLAAMKRELEEMRSALAEEKAADEVADEINEEAAETAEAAVEETAEEAPAAVSADVDEIARKIDELTARIDELLTPDEEDYEESAEETAAPVADVSGEIGEINRKIDELTARFEELISADEEPEEEGEEVAEAENAEEAPAPAVATSEEVNELGRKIDELTARFEELISADEELGDEGEETAEAENAEEAEGEDEVKAELEAIRTALDEIRHDPAIQELKGEVAELTARIDELFAEPEEAEVAEGEEETDPVQAEFDEIKEKLEEIRNDPALQELKGEVAELTARIDELVARGAEESAEAEEAEPADDAALGEIKEEIEDINRQLDQIKAMLAAGAVVAAAAAAQPEEEAEQEEPVEEEPAEEPVAEEVVEEVAEEAEEPVEEVSEETSEETAEEVAAEEPETVEESEEETAVEAAEESAEEPAEEAASEEPAAEDEGEEEEEQLVTVSDIVDESELSDEPEDEVLENIFDDVEEQTVKGEAQPDGIPGISNGGVDFANMMKYNRSFIARIIQSSDDVKRYYGQIKNAMLAYKKVNSSIAWGAERFNKGRETIAKLKIRGKTLCLYLNLDPNEFKTSVYHQIDVSDNKSMHGTPMMVKVKSPLGVKKAIRLIDAMLAKRNGEKRPIQERDYAAMYPYETIEELIEDGLVKDVSKNK